MRCDLSTGGFLHPWPNRSGSWLVFENIALGRCKNMLWPPTGADARDGTRSERIRCKVREINDNGFGRYRNRLGNYDEYSLRKISIQILIPITRSTIWKPSEWEKPFSYSRTNEMQSSQIWIFISESIKHRFLPDRKKYIYMKRNTRQRERSWIIKKTDETTEKSDLNIFWILMTAEFSF